MDKARLHATVEGRVQGVGFRYFVADRAYQYRLCGWVRNRREGQVELVAEGPRMALERFLQDIRQGPTSSFVSDVRVEWEEPQGELTKFHIGETV